jgi:hypothetical protein
MNDECELASAPVAGTRASPATAPVAAIVVVMR